MDLGALNRLVPNENWRPFPPAADRAAWQELLDDPMNVRRRDATVVLAAELAAEPVSALPATAFMGFVRTGDREAYQRADGLRSARLTTLVLAECFEGQGRFLDPLVDTIWAVCEQSTWCWPAHDGRRLLTDVTDPIVDLRASHIGWTLAEVVYLLGEALDGVGPAVRERIRLEVDRRILKPFLTRDDFWWLAIDKTREVNNWTAVCCAGVVAAAMVLEDDEVRLVRILRRSLESLERFLDCYGPDGGCDEGPSYWNYGVGHLAMLAEILLSRTDGQLNLYDDPRVRAMAEFPHRVHLAGSYYVNFADCGPTVTFSRAVVRRYAERVESEGLLALASQQPQWSGGEAGLRRAGDLTDAIRQLFWDRPRLEPRPIPKEAATWFPDLQWMVARHNAREAGTLTLAAKAGHNAEKHNHNDGGAFAVYLAGEPMIVDIGAEQYCRQTFSAERYQRLAMRSLGHNVPVIRGLEQAAGRDRSAADVRFEADDQRVSLEQELKGFYPSEAHVNTYLRRIELDRSAPAGTVRLVDTVLLAGLGGVGTQPLTAEASRWQTVVWPREPGSLPAMLLPTETSGRQTPGQVKKGVPAAGLMDLSNRVIMPLYTPHPCRVEGPGRIIVTGRGASLLVAFDPAVLQATIERLALADPRLRTAWGDSLARIWLCSNALSGRTRLEATFTPLSAI